MAFGGLARPTGAEVPPGGVGREPRARVTPDSPSAARSNSAGNAASPGRLATIADRRPRLFALVALGCLSLFAAPVPAQEPPPAPEGPERSLLVPPGPDELQVLVLESGSTLIGRIVEGRGQAGAHAIRFLSGEMELTIAIQDIRELRIVPASSIRSGAYWFPNPNRTRLFFAPTARTLPQGGGYLSDHLLFFPGFAYGITDRITLGGGMSLFPGISLAEQFAFATPKIGWQVNEGFDVAVGALMVAIPVDFGDDTGDAGILFSVATWGSPDSSVTAGAGYGWAGNDWADKPMVMLGGERRLSRRISLVTENWVFPGLDAPLVSLGVRFMGERMSVDLAGIHLLGEEGAFAPLLSFIFLFGER